MYENYGWKYVLTALITLLFGWALAAQPLSLGIDLRGGSEMLYRLDTSQVPGAKPDLTDTTISVLQNRLDALAIKELSIRKQGNWDIVIQVPGASLTEVEQIKQTVGTTGRLDFKLVVTKEKLGSDALVDAEIKEVLRKKAEGTWKPYVEDGQQYDPYDVAQDERGMWQLLENRGVSGRYLRDAERSTDQALRPAVGFKWNSTGRNKFYEMTSNNVGRQMAIVLDGVAKSAPVIRSAISDQGIIEGGQSGFSEDEVKRLVVILKAGALPAKPVFQYEQKVGATLGQAAIFVGGIATLLSMALVLAFMVWYYKVGGVIADIALVLNILLLLGTLAMFGATLTLPGIAGILLTAGMAVDANILIFERMREEKARGADPKATIEVAYDRAFWTIFDSHVTTLLTGLVLYWTGTGPIKGFAVTLMIGISISLFTSLFVTKMIYGWLGANEKLPAINFRHLILAPNFDFMGFFPKALKVSLILINVGFAVFLFRGVHKYGIDFTGGTVLQMRLRTPLEKSEVDKRIRDTAGIKEFDSQRVGDPEKDGIDKGTEFTVITRNLAEQLKGKVGEKKTGLAPTKNPFLRAAHGEDAPVASPTTANVGSPTTTEEPVAAAPASAGAAEDQSYFRQKIEELFKEELIVAFPPMPGAGREPFAVEAVDANRSRIKFRVNMVPLSTAMAELNEGVVLGAVKQGLASIAGDLRPAKSAQENARRALAGEMQNDLAVKIVGHEAGKVATVEVSASVAGGADMQRLGFEALRKACEANATCAVADPFPRVDQIGGAVAKNLRTKAFISMFFALIAIVLYVAVRFEFIWGVGAILSLAHDLFATIGFLAILDTIFSVLGVDFDAKINLPTVAAILTLLGFSITDTIVVYDRIREKTRLNKLKHPDAATINEAINGTLSRTILTSLTVFLVAVVLFGCSFANLKVIQGFSLAMCFGVVTGTLSSIFIAAPTILADMRKLRLLLGAEIVFFIALSIVAWLAGVS